ncbi:MAG TPA: zf-TFIIB domain-containing protein [Oscillatoriaceae cyanobacterium]
MSDLACPRCNTAMSTYTVTTDEQHWEIEIDACKHCGGLWLEDHDFEVDPKARLLLDDELLVLNRGEVNVNTALPANCPECGVAMHRYNWNNEGILLDSCKQCHGRWIDGGEIADVRASWGVEPITPEQEAELQQRIAQIAREEDAIFAQQGFGGWLKGMLTRKRV